MKKLLALASMVAGVAGCCVFSGDTGATATAVSPDGRNEIRLYADPLSYEVVRDGVTVVARTDIGMKVDGACLARQAKDPVVTKETVSGTIDTPVYKKSQVNLAGEEAFADFGDWGVRLAARDDGVAYRFETKKSGRIKVECEKATVNIPCPKAKALVYKTRAFGCEESVPQNLPAGEIKTKSGEMVYLPLVYTIGGKTVAVTESDVRDYPWWNLTRGTAEKGVALDSLFAKWPVETKNVDGHSKQPGDEKRRLRKMPVVKTADYLVETDGTRTFPWRTFILAEGPSKLCEADIVYALAAPKCEKADFSWVRPGKVAWDWWNAWDNQGDKGCNTKTYERFIDFAAKTGVEYVIFDEGWSERLNIWKFHPDVDVPHLIKYAEKKNVGIILWMAWAQVYGDEEHVAEHFAKLGAKGFKVDFMDRADADVARFIEKFAKVCAENRMVLDYHGMTRPVGLSRRYPNVLNYEGIHGLEQMKFFHGQDMVGNDVAAFFGRLSAGPMDYTPGAMINLPVGTYPTNKQDPSRYNLPGSEGTRCRQMAMMALYEAPLQMLSDSPSNYEKNMESFSFMAQVPVVWDETIGLGGGPDSYAAVARRKGNVWYVAGMTNREGRDFALDTSFLGEGPWKVECFRDGADAEKKPESYIHERGTMAIVGTNILFKMAPGGGFIVKFTK